VKITLEGASDEEFVVNMPDTEFFVDPTSIRWLVRTAATGPTLRSRINVPPVVLLGRGEGAEHPSPGAGRPIDAAPCQPASARATRPAKAANERSIRSRDSPLTMKTMRELWSSSGHSGK
jgi:hypothetical protein